MARWEEIPLNAAMVLNLEESALREGAAVMENAFINEAKGHSRFPGRQLFCQLPDQSPVYLSDWRNDIVACTQDGRTFRVDRNGRAEDATRAILSGGQRVQFSPTDDQLLMTAGAEILKLGGPRTEVLSENAPLANFVAYLDGFTLAPERETQQFYIDDGTNEWNAADVFSAESQPDPITTVTVTRYREVIFGGPRSLEQWEPYPGGDRPFFRRWTFGEGVLAPYTLVSDENGTWAVNADKEFVRYIGQSSQHDSSAVDRELERISMVEVDDWTDAWAGVIKIQGQKFIVLSIPRARNQYGTDGIALLYEYRRKRWSFLYGWDAEKEQPARWPINSLLNISGKIYAGGLSGEIYELVPYLHDPDERVLWRGPHMDKWGRSQVEGVQMRVSRGTGVSNFTGGTFELRARRDGDRWTRWITKTLGRQGKRDFWVLFNMGFGDAYSWQWEYRITSDQPVEVTSMRALVSPLG